MIFRRKRTEPAEEPLDDELEDAADGTGTARPRATGPYDVTEVDLADDGDQRRIDLGAIIVAGFPGMELQLQVAEETQEVVAAVLVFEESALELGAFAAPRSGGLWAELQDEYVAAATAAGGTAELRDGPFGLELHRVVPVDLPDGRRGVQETRTWMAEGSRWMLRGILHGAAARVEGTDGVAEQLYDAYRQVVVRRGDVAMGPGDPLPLRLPEEAKPS